MRVGLVVPGFSANVQDWCIPALRHLARSLATQDDVRVIAVRYPYSAARYTVEGAEVIALGGAERRGPATPDVWRRTLAVLRAEHRRRAFDVLHAFWATESGLLAALAGRALRIPTVVSLAGGELVALPAIGYGDQRVAWERLKVRASMRLASAVTAGSDYLLGLAAGHMRPHAGRLHRAPLGVDLDLFKPVPGASADGCFPRLVHVATLTRIKDQVTLLRAFASLRGRLPEATLDIVGDGPLRRDLERLADELGVPQAVRFRGSVDHAALPGVYRAASAFVLSSRHEAQGMVAIEAAACGVPVVGTRVGVIPELAASADAVVSVGASEALADALFATCTAADRLVRAQTIQAHARTAFGLAPCVARFRALYAQVSGA
ncbi:MAG TPA: glycosyltransferase family 4 protein [Chloroflexota bacterium]|nr:glycosyltransferase family 4 protein [Chloroflexota bacterium]